MRTVTSQARQHAASDDLDEAQMARDYQRRVERSRVRRDAACPETAPWLSDIVMTPGQHSMRFSDWNGNGRRPAGADAIEIYVVKAAQRVFWPVGGEFVGRFKRPRITLPIDPRDDGLMASYFGRWVTRRGVAGPWSQPACMWISC